MTSLPGDVPLVYVLAIVAGRRLTMFTRDRWDRVTCHWAFVADPYVPAAPIGSLAEARLNWAVDRGLIELRDGVPAALTPAGWEAYVSRGGSPLTAAEQAERARWFDTLEVAPRA